MVEELRTSIQDNGEVVVLGVGETNFDPPIAMAEFQKAVVTNRTAIEEYFTAVIAAQKAFSAKTKSSEIVEALSGILRKGLIEEFQKLHGITIHEIKVNTPSADVQKKGLVTTTKEWSVEELEAQKASYKLPQKVWKRYSGIKDETDPNDVRRQEIVQVITKDFRATYDVEARGKVSLRKNQAVALDYMTSRVFESLKNLDPRWEDHILGIMIAEGWRVIAIEDDSELRLTGPHHMPLLLPFGRGVPTCAKDSKDHPIWDGL